MEPSEKRHWRVKEEDQIKRKHTTVEESRRGVVHIRKEHAVHPAHHLGRHEGHRWEKHQRGAAERTLKFMPCYGRGEALTLLQFQQQYHTTGYI
eukprot:583424-Pelagomonas_calceolata.AAC.4